MTFILLKEKCDKLGTDERWSGEEVSRLGVIVGEILSAAIHNVGLETARCLFNG